MGELYIRVIISQNQEVSLQPFIDVAQESY